MALGLAACGSDSSGADDPLGPALDGTGSVVVHVVSRSGAPVSGVEIGLFNGMDDLSATTDEEGLVEFRRFPAGWAGVSIHESGFHSAVREFTIDRNSTMELTLEVLRAAEATPVLLATHSIVAENGRTLTLDLDLAVLGEDGLSIPTLTAADFQMPGSDCGFGWCVMDAEGAPLPAGGYTAETEVGGFGWTDVATVPPTASATALLLENSAAVLDFDPGLQRSAAVHAYLDSVTAPDTVALASYHGSFWMPVLETYGSLTSEGNRFHVALDGMSRDDAHLNPLHEVLGRMLSWTAEQESDDPKTLVLVAGRLSEPDDGCSGSPYCNHKTRAALAGSARALGLPITGLGGDGVVADIAVRSGGSYVDIGYPEQYSVAFENLEAITSGRLGFNRVRFVLNAYADGVFASGHTIWTYGQVRIGTDTVLSVPVVVAIP